MVSLSEQGYYAVLVLCHASKHLASTAPMNLLKEWELHPTTSASRNGQGVARGVPHRLCAKRWLTLSRLGHTVPGEGREDESKSNGQCRWGRYWYRVCTRGHDLVVVASFNFVGDASRGVWMGVCDLLCHRSVAPGNTNGAR